MQTDEALAARLVDGDELALRELLRRYERPLAAFLHRQTGGRDVEDLYQEPVPAHVLAISENQP